MAMGLLLVMPNSLESFSFTICHHFGTTHVAAATEDWALEAIGWEKVGKHNHYVQHIFWRSQYHPSTVLETTPRSRQCSQGFGPIIGSQTTFRITRSQITWISRDGSQGN